MSAAPGDRSPVQIRRAAADDAARLALVGQATFVETFAGVLDGDDIVAHCERQHSVAAYERWLADGEIQLWLAEVAPGRAPVGFVMTAPCALPIAGIGADDLEVKRISLLQRFHGSGVGARLMQTAVDYARAQGKRRLLLGVYSGNERALAFYQRQGFERVGERPFTVGAHQYRDFVLARAVTKDAGS